MGKVILDMSMSLDGFIGGLQGEDHGLHNWYFSPSESSKQVNDELIDALGAIVMGRRSYDLGEKSGGYEDSPYQAVNFVVTHHVPQKVAKGAESFIFVTEGVESAMKQARAAAGDKDVAIGGGANIARQCLVAGLIDEIQIHLVPILIGEGIRLFDHSDVQAVTLEKTRVIDAPDVTHLLYRVVK